MEGSSIPLAVVRVHRRPSPCLPSVRGLCSQTFLMSATLSSDLDELKRTVLHTPAVLKLEEGSSDGHLAQFFVEVPRYDKYLLLYALMKLNLISGKAIFFVNDVERCVGDGSRVHLLRWQVDVACIRFCFIMLPIELLGCPQNAYLPLC